MANAFDRCPHLNCKLKCRSVSHHRARYADMNSRRTTVTKASTQIMRSPKINYEALAKLFTGTNLKDNQRLINEWNC